MINLKHFIRDVPDWPKPGIVFKDITPLLNHPAALSMAIEQMVNPFRGRHIDLVCGAESRGFIFGTALAQTLSAGFVPIRKPNKLPRAYHSAEYELEYGTDVLQMHQDAIQPGQRVLLADDLLATGGTLTACIDLINRMGCELVGITCLIELTFLNGRKKIAPHDQVFHSAIQY